MIELAVSGALLTFVGWGWKRFTTKVPEWAQRGRTTQDSGAAKKEEKSDYRFKAVGA